MIERYELDSASIDQIERAFTYHPPFGDQTERYVHLRNEAAHLAYEVLRCCPPSRERSLALTNLEQAVFWANAAIARNEHPPATSGDGP